MRCNHQLTLESREFWLLYPAYPEIHNLENKADFCVLKTNWIWSKISRLEGEEEAPGFRGSSDDGDDLHLFNYGGDAARGTRQRLWRPWQEGPCRTWVGRFIRGQNCQIAEDMYALFCWTVLRFSEFVQWPQLHCWTPLNSFLILVKVNWQIKIKNV